LFFCESKYKLTVRPELCTEMSMSHHPLNEKLSCPEEGGTKELPLQVISDNGLPENLPPFDIAAALIQLNGNAQLLRKLLLLFCDMYGAAVPQIRRMMMEGQYADAQRLAHSLRGSAGTLNTGELSAAASAVEHALKDGNMAQVDLLIDALERELTPALAAAASLGSASSSPSPSQPSPPVPNETVVTVADLRECIAANNVKARKLFAQIRSRLVGFGVDDQVGKIGACLECLDFAGALSVLDQVMNRFEPALSG
jgi:two-component system, sensor histidine kinase and response regulator